MERHLARLIAVAFLLAAALLVILPSASAGTCITADTCVNATNTATSDGVVLGSGGYDGSQSACEDAGGLGGTYDASDSIESIAACHVIITGGSATACGEGVIDAEGCSCGTTITTASDIGQYCCWDGDIAADADSCSAPSACSQDVDVSDACSCAGFIIGPGSANDQYNACCGGTRPVADASACSGILPPEICGDNIKQGGEQCDSQYVYSQTTPVGWRNTTGPGCGSATQLCTATCACLDVSAIGPSCGNSVCDAGEDYTTCLADCPAPPTCSLNPQGLPAASIASAIYDPVAGTVTLRWSAPDTSSLDPACQGSLVGYAVQRSKTSTQAAINAPDAAFSNPPNLGQTQFVDNSVPAATSTTTILYYALIAYYNTPGGVITVPVTTSVDIPSATCPVANAHYCKTPQLAINCNGYVPEPLGGTACTSGEVCLVVNGRAQCQAASTACNQCNGFLGTFVDDNIRIPDVGLELACKDSYTCYKDLGETSVELYKSCTNITSCVGYRTQAACELDKCSRGGVAGSESGCQWTALDNVTNRGVCTPAIEELATCGSCNVLGSGCTKEVCQAIDESCYYHVQFDGQSVKFNAQGQSDPSARTTGCYEKKDVPCEYLPTQKLCEGTPQQKYVLDASYNNGVRASGTNAINQSSGDILNHGKCFWFTDATSPNGGVCQKDADQNANPDWKDTLTEWQRRREVLLDFASPLTSILAVPGRLMPAQFEVTLANQSTVRVCFAYGSSLCYPDETRWISGTRITSPLFTPAQSGGWTMRYYGEDRNRNLEEVRSFPFTVDTKPPVITVTQQNTTLIFAPGGSLRTAAYLRFQADEPVWCNTTLIDANANAPAAASVRGASDLDGAYGQNFSVSYPSLPDGVYNVDIRCVDAGGNVNVPLLVSVVADTDFNITNPSPTNASPRNSTAVQLRIETAKDASCRFGPAGTAYNLMQDYDGTGGTVHTASRTYPTGLYLVQTACDIDGTVLYGGAGDTIVFAIDVEPPAARVCDANSPDADSDQCTPLNTSQQAETFRVTLRCTDSPTATPSFGCRKEDSQICVYKQGDAPCSLQPGFTTNEINGTQNQVVRYRVVDRGGNSAGVEEVVLQTRDLTPPGQPLFDLFPKK